MKRIMIVNRYIFRELLPPFAINVVFFTIVFLMAQMLKITDLIVNYSVGLGAVLKILLFSAPNFLVYVIPMSIMLAVLLTFLRMSGDNEIIAMKTGGISLYRVLPPVFMFCLCGFLLAFFMSAYGAPIGKHAIKLHTFKILSNNLDIGLKERTFNDSFKDVMLYVNKIDLKSKLLIDVFIEDQREKDIVTTVVAPRGRLFAEAGNLIYHLRLFNGTINQVSLEKRSAHSISFDTYDVRLDLKAAMAEAAVEPEKSWKEMPLGELHRYITKIVPGDGQGDSDSKSLLKYHKIISLPFACFFLGLLAVPLGVQSKSAQRSMGLILGLFFFLIYYLLLSAGHIAGESGRLPPPVAMWLPNIVMGILGFLLLIMTARERSIGIGTWGQPIARWMTRLGRRYRHNRINIL